MTDFEVQGGGAEVMRAIFYHFSQLRLLGGEALSICNPISFTGLKRSSMWAADLVALDSPHSHSRSSKWCCDKVHMAAVGRLWRAFSCSFVCSKCQKHGGIMLSLLLISRSSLF